MTEQMENLVVAKRESGARLDVQIRDIPVSFVNALRRILLDEMPVVEVQDVRILTNTSAMPHEMLRHRFEMLPVNVPPTAEDTIRATKLELRIQRDEDGTQDVTTDDISGKDVLMKDRDLGEPLLVARIKKGEAIHVQARLGINPAGSHVCLATYGYRVNPDAEKVEQDRQDFVMNNPNLPDAVKVFNQFYIQRSFSKDEKGRPNWFDFSVETIGVLRPMDLLKMASRILRERTRVWKDSVKENIVRSQEQGVYTFVSSENDTLGALLQIVLYDSDQVELVDYDIPHPLRQEMRLRIKTDKQPEAVLSFVTDKITEYCSRLEKELS
jgi:DNA-directed RNA polymerase II subunit RPB3